MEETRKPEATYKVIQDYGENKSAADDDDASQAPSSQASTAVQPAAQSQERLRKEKRLAMNRETARARRKRRKDLLENLTARVDALSAENQQLRATAQSLSARNQQLEQQLQIERAAAVVNNGSSGVSTSNSSTLAALSPSRQTAAASSTSHSLVPPPLAPSWLSGSLLATIKPQGSALEMNAASIAGAGGVLREAPKLSQIQQLLQSHHVNNRDSNTTAMLIQLLKRQEQDSTKFSRPLN